MSVSVPCGYSCAWRLALRPEPGQNRMNAMICGRKLRRRRVGKLSKLVLWQRRHMYIGTDMYVYVFYVCVCKQMQLQLQKEGTREINICQASATYAKLELLEYLAEVSIHLL